jgi:hypothetical protein
VPSIQREKLTAGQFSVGMKMPVYDAEFNMTVREIASIQEGKNAQQGNRLVTFTDGTRTILEGRSDRNVVLFHWRVL